jgi:hypothetical protein
MQHFPHLYFVIFFDWLVIFKKINSLCQNMLVVVPPFHITFLLSINATTTYFVWLHLLPLETFLCYENFLIIDWFIFQIFFFLIYPVHVKIVSMEYVLTFKVWNPWKLYSMIYYLTICINSSTILKSIKKLVVE